MTRDQLEHAIRVACHVSGDTELLIFGLQSILGSYPNAPETLRASIEVDIQSKNHPDNTDLIDGETLLKRAETLPVKAERRQAIERWIRITAEDIG